jgi:signal transduction histidine kinase
VTDNGPGMTAEQAARVFERFYRTDQSRSRARGGTGLGLSIVAALVHAHRGTIAVDTRPGHGAAFRVRLPLATASGASVDDRSRSARHIPPPPVDHDRVAGQRGDNPVPG